MFLGFLRIFDCNGYTVTKVLKNRCMASDYLLRDFSGVFRIFHCYVFTVTKVLKNSCIASDYLVRWATYSGPINKSDNNGMLSLYKLLNDRVLFFQKQCSDSDLSRSHKCEQQITRDRSTLYQSLLTNTLDIHTYVYVCIHICVYVNIRTYVYV